MVAQELMIVRYNTTRGDLIAASIRSVLHSRIILAMWVFFITRTCYSALQGPKIVDMSLGSKVFFSIILGGLFSAFFFGTVIAVAVAAVLLKKNKGVLGEHRLAISDDGILESTIHNESLNRWSTYHKTVSTRSHLLLYVNEGHFHIISKKRPLIEGDLVAFEAALNEKTKRG